MQTELSSPFIPELLAPVGSMDQLDAAILYGANAVYLGGSASLRAGRPFSAEALATARAKTKAAGVQLFFCCNAFPRQHDLSAALENLTLGAEAGVDAYIIADAGVFSLARKHFPHIPIHLSTQANTCNAASVAFWHDLGAERVNLARELRLHEIRAIRKACPEVELECFVHGAQCLAISGQCLLSAWLNNRPANAGQCTQPCRFEYRPMPGTSQLFEESWRTGTPTWEITQGDDKYSAFWSPEDLCLLPFVPWFMRQKITALKIEGRMRTGAYTAHAVDGYRRAIDMATQVSSHKAWKEALPELMFDIEQWTSRDLGTGFFLPKHQKLALAHNRGKGGFSPLLARLEEELQPGTWRISVRSQWKAERKAYVFMPEGQRPLLEQGKYRLENHLGESVDTVHPGMEATLHCDVQGLSAGAYVEAVV